MNIEDRITRAKELIARREDIDRQLAALFGGVAPSRKVLRCSSCGEEGHNAKTCPKVLARDAATSPGNSDATGL